MKKIATIFSMLLVLLVITGCGAIKLSPEKQAFIDKKTSLYTQVTMWSDKDKVVGTNYSVSSIVPINSKVTIISVSASTIVFSFNGQKLSYAVTSSYTKINANQMLDRLFGTSSVDLSKSTKEVQANITRGVVARGMTKEEVLLARGYPPFHETASTKADTWKYWRNKWTTGTVTFENNIVTRSSVFKTFYIEYLRTIDVSLGTQKILV